MGITSSGLASGINFDQLIQQVQDSQRRPVTLLQARQATYQKEIGAVQSVSTKLSTLLAVASSVNNPSNFNINSASGGTTAAGASLLSATADSTATKGTYAVSVKQLAKASKLAAAGFVDQNTTAIASADGSFKFKVGNAGTEYSVAVTSSTTLQSLRDAINAAAGSATATIINDGTGSNPYRLILTANESGASNTVQVTTNGTTLNFAKTVEAAYAFTGNSFAGTVTSGGAYTGSANKTFLVEAVAGGAPGAATYKYSIDGGLTYLGYGGAAYNATALTGTAGAPIVAAAGATAIDGSGATNEGVTVGFGAAGTLVAGDKFSVDVFNPAFQTGQDAVVVVDGTTYTKSTNSVADIIQGVTLNLSQVDATNSVNVTVSSDAAAAVGKIKNFVAAYNEFNTFLNGQLNYDPVTKQAGPLLGDPALRAIQKQLKDIVSGQVAGLTTGKANLSQIGITSSSKTGQLTVNDATLSSAITADPEGVKRLFLGIGTPSNSLVTFVGLSQKTAAGRYGINVTTAAQKAVVGGSGVLTNLSSTPLALAETLSFSYSGDYSAATPTTTSFGVTLSAGLKINDIVSSLNSAFATQKVGLSASNDGGSLKITAKDYGKDIRFTVVSNQAAAGQTGIGSVGLTAQGADIAGTINDHQATGKGNVLTSNSGFTEDGLAISTDSASTGLFGTIDVTRGVGDRLVSSLATYTDPTAGILTAKSSGLQKNVDRLASDMKKLNDRIAIAGDAFRAQLVRLESILSKTQATSNYLTNQMAKLPKIGA